MDIFLCKFFFSFFFYFRSYPLLLSSASFINNFVILNFGISLYMRVTAQKAFHLFEILPRHVFELCLLWKLSVAITTPPFSPVTGFAFSLWFVCFCSAMDHSFFVIIISLDFAPELSVRLVQEDENNTNQKAPK